MTENPTLQEAIVEYDRVRDILGGCTDGGCVVKKPKGMHTNGGCKCATDSRTAQRMMHLGQILADAVRATLKEPT